MDRAKGVLQSDLNWQLEQARLRSTQNNTKVDSFNDVANSDACKSNIDDGSVKVGLAKYIQDELNTDRSEKIAKLKELIASGKYHPDTTAIAMSVADTIDDEVTLENLGNS